MFRKYLATVVAVSSLVGFASVPAQAMTFDNTGLKFDQDTTVEFDFLSSNGWYRSDLSIVDATGKNILDNLFAEGANNSGYNLPQTGDFLGTCGQAGSTVAAPCYKDFTFKAGQTYSLRLDSTQPNGAALWSSLTPTVYSTNTLNNPQTLQAQFTGDVMSASGVTIAFDDRGGAGSNNGLGDKDFNDFKVKATAISVPEPATLAGLGLVAGALFATRRRQSAKLS